jgi:hypothetical protein
MNFDPEIFISYAHLDDEAGWRGHKWISDFHRALEIRVSQLLGRQIQIWRDPKLHGNDPLTDALISRVRCAATLVSIVSPRYLKSDWTLRELREFCASAQTGPKNKSRVFKIVKTPVVREEEIPPLPELLGYEFFKTDPAIGRSREFDDPEGREYWEKIEDVAQDLSQLLTMLEDPAIQQSTPGKTVYLAETTTDLAAEYSALKRDLQQHGYHVLPSRPLPLADKLLRDFVRGELAQADLSVHLIGKNYSLVPEDATLSLSEIQHEIAMDCAEQGSLRRLVWIPPALEIGNEKQRAFAANLRLSARNARSICWKRRLRTFALLFMSALGKIPLSRKKLPPAAKSSSTSSLIDKISTASIRGGASCSNTSRSCIRSSKRTKPASERCMKRTCALRTRWSFCMRRPPNHGCAGSCASCKR